MFHDFGYVALDILDVRSEDAGTYTVVARNALGEAQSETTMIVETRSSVDTTSMHRVAYDKAQRLEESKFQVNKILKKKVINILMKFIHCVGASIRHRRDFQISSHLCDSVERSAPRQRR